MCKSDVQKINSQLAEPSLQLELQDVAHLLLLVPARWDKETGEELQLVGLIFRERRLRIICWFMAKFILIISVKK